MADTTSGLYHKIITAGYMFGTPITQSIAKSASFVLPKGSYLILPDTASDWQLEFNTTGSTWVVIFVKGQSAGLMISDGVKIRATNTDASNATNFVYIPIL